MTNFNSDGFDPETVEDEIDSIMEEDFQEQKNVSAETPLGR